MIKTAKKAGVALCRNQLIRVYLGLPPWELWSQHTTKEHANVMLASSLAEPGVCLQLLFSGFTLVLHYTKMETYGEGRAKKSR